VPAEIKELHAYGVTHLYSVEDGQKMGLQGMINDMVQRCDVDLSKRAPQELKALEVADAPSACAIWRRSSPRWKRRLAGEGEEGAARKGRRTSAPTAVPTWASPAPAAPASPR
jgi:hypothetical protein